MRRLSSQLRRGVNLAALLVVASALPARADQIIDCLYDEGGCYGVYGHFDPGLGFQAITWRFQDSWPTGNVVYSFTLAGIPTQSFWVDVTDHWPGSLSNVPSGLTCVQSDQGYCLLFTATAYTAPPGSIPPGVPTTPTWVGGYNVAVLWNAGDTIAPPYYATILKHGNTDETDFGGASLLTDIRYAPDLAPPDPGIGGRGDSFSTFGVFQGGIIPARLVETKQELYAPVPEPASMILLGTGLAGLAVRARRRRS